MGARKIRHDCPTERLKNECDSRLPEDDPEPREKWVRLACRPPVMQLVLILDRDAATTCSAGRNIRAGSRGQNPPMQPGCWDILRRVAGKIRDASKLTAEAIRCVVPDACGPANLR